ncbi:restin homolog [Dendronephthya gigantea]|uniref:restin homolog n=1 Tax=Dendronephthya gigantea TaxID=151771 RepID=UPI001069538C|nr:restin homolog [Dendronephthya gigantea]
MSKETVTNSEPMESQKMEENSSNNALDDKANKTAASHSMEAQSSSIDKTPIPSVTIFNELHHKQNESNVGNESIETSEPAGFNETECIKFAEKLYKTKHMLENQSGEQEIKALKDEIRSLHLAKVENQCKDIFKQCTQVLATVDKVDANMSSSRKLNKKLGFMNEHQKCILLTYKEKYEKTKQELISLQACNVSSSSEGEQGANKKESKDVHLEDELRMQKELCQQVQVQLNDSRQEIQELLKSLDNAHSLLSKHVETNNKFAESETMLHLELDDLRTECESCKEELKSERLSVQEKEAKMKELEDTKTEQEKELNAQIKQLQKQIEAIVEEKKSLEELNTTWSQKIAEQGNEIELTREKMTEVETTKEETEQKLAVKSSEVEVLEEKLKTEVSRYENLLQAAQEGKAMKMNEANKWRERTTELLKNENELKDELDKVKKESLIKELQDQETQTEVIEKVNKEINTSVSLNENSTILDKENQSSTTEKTVAPVANDNIETSSPTTKESATDNVSEIQQQNAATAQISTELSSGTNSKPTAHESTKTVANQKQIEDSTVKKHSDENSPVKGQYFQSTMTSEQGVTATPPVAPMKEISTVSTKLQTSYAFQNNLSQNEDVDLSNTATQKNTSIIPSEDAVSLDRESTEMLDESRLQENSKSLSIEGDTLTSNSRVMLSGKGCLKSKTTKSTHGTKGNALGRKASQEKRAPLLAVVKPSSQGTLIESASTRTGVQVSPRTLFQTPTSDSPTRSKGMAEIPEKTNTDDQEMGFSSAGRVATNQTVSKAKPTTEEISEPEEPLTGSISLLGKLMIPDQNKQSESKQESKPTAGDDFCFSDEEESIIPRAIGDQVNRIEIFLKNERLRLSKKRKSIDE